MAESDPELPIELWRTAWHAPETAPTEIAQETAAVVARLRTVWGQIEPAGPVGPLLQRLRHRALLRNRVRAAAGCLVLLGLAAAAVLGIRDAQSGLKNGSAVAHPYAESRSRPALTGVFAHPDRFEARSGPVRLIVVQPLPSPSMASESQ